MVIATRVLASSCLLHVHVHRHYNGVVRSKTGCGDGTGRMVGEVRKGIGGEPDLRLLVRQGETYVLIDMVS
jgi:hypothetical protein